MHASLERLGILIYGSVELRLCDLYPPGEVVAVNGRMCLEMVDRVEKADGIVILGLVPRAAGERPACLCTLFTHYMHHPYRNLVDHTATILHLRPTEKLRRETERAVREDLLSRSLTASLAYDPTVRYL